MLALYPIIIVYYCQLSHTWYILDVYCLVCYKIVTEPKRNGAFSEVLRDNLEKCVLLVIVKNIFYSNKNHD